MKRRNTAGEFLFLGANIDTVKPPPAWGYHKTERQTTVATARARLNYEVVGQAVAAVHDRAPLDEHWKDAIDEDFRKRRS